MEINWTVLTYFVIGLFGLNGFFRGWWKEAFTTLVLAVLVFFLHQPDAANLFVSLINEILATIVALLPTSPAGAFGPTPSAALVNPADGGSWLLILIGFLAVAILLSRASLPDGPGGYGVRPMGSLLGGLVGGLNGFILMNLIREYLDGRNLPGNISTLPTEIAGTGGGVGIASSGVSIQAVNVPTFTILDSFVPWVVIFIGLVLFLMALKNRIGLPTKNGFIKVEYRQPYGYKKYS